MIEVQNLTKRYGSHLAVDNASFTIRDGEILGFLGPNGAGKTTTMNIITGYISASSGSVIVDGYDILESPKEVKRRIGFLPEQPPLYLDMTVKEYLGFIYDLKKVKAPKEPHIKEICQLVKISDVYGRLIKNLSKGYRQRIGIAQALIGNPKVLILDEPTVGLDPQQVIDIRTLIKQLGKNHTVIISSHILSEIQAVSQRVIVINEGRIVADDTPDNLSRKMTSNLSLRLRIEGPKQDVIKAIRSVPGVRSVICRGESESGSLDYIVEPDDNADVRPALFNKMAAEHYTILLMQGKELSLEEVFLGIIKKSAKDSKAQPSSRRPDRKHEARKLAAAAVESALHPEQDVDEEYALQDEYTRTNPVKESKEAEEEEA